MPKDILNRASDPRPAPSVWWPVRLTAKYRRDALTCVQALFVRLMVVNSGAAAAEYTFLIAFISILAAIGMVLLGDDLQAYFLGLQQALANASTPTADPFS